MVLDESLQLLYTYVVNRYKPMTVTTNERGQNNMFAVEPTMYMTDEDRARYGIESHAERAEKLNGRTAMMGFVAALLSYAVTGKLFFGII